MLIQWIRARETNCFLLHGDGGTVLVDPGPPGVEAKVIAETEGAGLRPEQVRLILITHGHLDHYGAAAGVKAWCGAPVAAHRMSPQFSRNRRNALPPAQTLRSSVFRWSYLLLAPLARFEPLQADLLLEDGVDLSAYGVKAQTVALPGHSPDSLGLVTPSGDVFVGDLLVNYAVPSQPIYLWNREAWQESYDRVRALKPRTVYIGHGEPFPGDQLKHIYSARYQLRWWVR